MRARFKLTKGGRTATLRFVWPDGAPSWGGLGTLVLESGAAEALEEMERVAGRLARRLAEISNEPFPPIPQPFLRRIDGVLKVASFAGWEFEWVDPQPADLETRFAPLPNGVVA